MGATAAGATVDMGNTAGETHVGSYASTQNVTFNNIGSTSVVVSDTASAGGTTAFNWASSLTGGSADAVSLVLNGTTQTISVDPTNNGIETVSVSGAGAAVATAGFTLGSAVSRLNLAGSVLLDLDATNLAATVTTIDASTSTGGVRVQQGRAMTSNFTGGSGNDMFWINDAATNLTAADTITGGAGTDTFVITTAIGAGTATNVTGFEVLGVDMSVGNINQDIDNFAATTVTVIAAGNNTLTVTDASPSTVVNVNATMTTGTVAATIKTNTASDAITLNIGGTAGGVTVGTLSPAASYETININSVGAAANTISALGTAFANATIGGTTALTITSTATGGTGVIDASALLAPITISAAALASQTLTLTGYSDTVSSITASGTINGGAGADTITSGSTIASAIINGGSGADTITLVGSVAAGHTVNGGDGVDVLTQGTTGTATIDFQSTAVTRANGDIITGFTTTVSDYDANQTLVNGTTASGVSSVLATVGSTVTSELSTALTSNANATAFVMQSNLSGDASTALTNLAGATASNFESLGAAFETALVAALGTITDLDNNLNSTDRVVITFDNGTHTAIVYVSNTTASGNTLTVDEIEVVGVFNGTAALAAGDII